MRRLWLCLILLAACGDAMVGGGYEGEPYLRVEGVFRGSTGDATLHNPQIGIIWAVEDDGAELEGVEANLRPIEGAPLANTFTFEIWDLPPAAALLPICGARMAIGSVAVYDDVNGDGRVRFLPSSLRFAAPDLALGFSLFSFLVYADAPLRDCEESFLSFPDLEPGFHVLDLQDCQRWRKVDASIEIHLFPPANSFPVLDDICPPEPA